MAADMEAVAYLSGTVNALCLRVRKPIDLTSNPR